MAFKGYGTDYKNIERQEKYPSNTVNTLPVDDLKMMKTANVSAHLITAMSQMSVMKSQITGRLNVCSKAGSA